MNKELFVGKFASISKTFTIKDVEEFAELSNDKNPVHLDEEFAKSSIFLSYKIFKAREIGI